MQKVLDRFKAEPNLANRKALEFYMARHPMAVCMCSVEDVRLLQQEGIL